MKNNKGFTLVEIIVTIGLLVLIATITIPSIISMQNRNKQKNLEKLKETIVTAAETYYQNNLDIGELDECYISLSTLANKNLIKTPITNPKTNEQIDIKNVYIKVTKSVIETNTKINYTYGEGTFNSSKICPMSDKIYVDSSGANYPELASGMIPVIYNDTDDVWEVADLSSEWYNYNNQMWANAVTVNPTASACNFDECIDMWDKHDREYYLNNPGTPISMDDINAMWVWIPRYKYMIPSNMGSSSNVTSPPQINIIFENNTSTSGVSEAQYREEVSDGSNTNEYYYTHPAFTFGSDDLTGFWTGKFETGTSDETCNSDPSTTNCKNVEPIIKPDILSLTYQPTSIQFKTALKFAGGNLDETSGNVSFNGSDIYGLISTTDTHMMKNTEWGAVAYLSHSQYGKYGNTNYTEKEIYINNSGYDAKSEYMYTGRSGGTTSKSATKYGTYSYNNKSPCTKSVCSGEKTEYAGTGASTTGTIYGIYDMNGGSEEYVMGNWGNNINKSEFSIFPSESKYYDLYQGTSISTITLEKTILGDATWETMKWYHDDIYSYSSSNYSWISRGGYYSNEEESGIWQFDNYTGDSLSRCTFRTVLVSQ